VWIRENFLSKNAKGRQENEANFWSQILRKFKFIESQNLKIR
jgi:hypothetical protein